jgi:hypothetical protein
MSSARNIHNNPSRGAAPSGGAAANMVTTDTPQTTTASKVFVGSQTYQGHILGSDTSDLHIHDIHLKGDAPVILVNESQIDSSALANNAALVKTSGDFSLSGTLALHDVSVSGNVTAADTSVISGNQLKLKGDNPSISVLDGGSYRPLDSTHLLDHDALVKTDSNHTLSGQIRFTQVPTVNDTAVLTVDQIATLQLNAETTQAPENGVIQSGANLFTEASPAPICVTDPFARIDSYYLFHDKFLPYVMGYSDVAKPNAHSHGLLPSGDINHEHQFLRKDGQWAQPSVAYAGTVSQVLTDMRDYPSQYTGAEGKYLKVTFGAQHPDGAGVEFRDVASDVVPIIANTLSNNSLSSIRCNGIIEGQQILVTSDERLKTDIADFSGGIELMRKIDTKVYKYVDSDTPNIGILAQDLLKDDTLKHSVHESESGFLKVDYTNLIGVLLDSVKQLIRRVDELSEK